MKKIVLVAFALCATVVANAQNFLKPVSGSVLELKEKEKSNVLIEWDYTHYTVNNQPAEEFYAQKGKDAWNEYTEEVQESEKSFYFFLNSKYLTPVTNKSIAKYVLRVRMDSYDSDNNKLTCGVEIYRVGESDPIAVYDTTPIPGVGDYWNRQHVKNAYIFLALDIRKAIKKAQ